MLPKLVRLFPKGCYTTLTDRLSQSKKYAFPERTDIADNRQGIVDFEPVSASALGLRRGRTQSKKFRTFGPAAGLSDAATATGAEA